MARDKLAATIVHRAALVAEKASAFGGTGGRCENSRIRVVRTEAFSGYTSVRRGNANFAFFLGRLAGAAPTSPGGWRFSRSQTPARWGESRA
jgi:hypothetical protein